MILPTNTEARLRTICVQLYWCRLGFDHARNFPFRHVTLIYAIPSIPINTLSQLEAVCLGCVRGIFPRLDCKSCAQDDLHRWWCFNRMWMGSYVIDPHFELNPSWWVGKWWFPTHVSYSKHALTPIECPSFSTRFHWKSVWYTRHINEFIHWGINLFQTTFDQDTVARAALYAAI